MLEKWPLIIEFLTFVIVVEGVFLSVGWWRWNKCCRKMERCCRTADEALAKADAAQARADAAMAEAEHAMRAAVALHDWSKTVFNGTANRTMWACVVGTCSGAGPNWPPEAPIAFPPT